YSGADRELIQECRRLVLAMVAAWRWDTDDPIPEWRESRSSPTQCAACRASVADTRHRDERVDGPSAARCAAVLSWRNAHRDSVTSASVRGQRQSGCCWTFDACLRVVSCDGWIRRNPG